MSVRRFAVAVVVAAALSFALAPQAVAAYQGSDVFSNVAPPPASQQSGGFSTRYPPGHYALDTHVDAGVTSPGGYVGLIPHFLASQLWDLTKLLVLATIAIFTWAFSLDLLSGGGGGGRGALAPVAEAIDAVYTHTFGRAWLVVGIVLAGLWGIWKSLVQRRYLETTGQLALSVAFVVTALFFVQQPEKTVGRASAWTNTMSLALLSGASGGGVRSAEQAKRDVSDHLFKTLVHEPWVVLDFGGLSHCVDSEHRSVAPYD